VQRALSPDRTLTAQDCFELLRERARAAGERGNYAISAALVIRDRGFEIVTVGVNTLFRSRDPSGHAEMNAIRLAHRLGAEDLNPFDLARHIQEGALRIRRIPNSAQTTPQTTLYTTLEPCPMCTACIITAGIQRVVIAAEDPPSGALSPERLHSLPPLWAELADSLGLEVCFCQTTNPMETDTYLTPALHDELIEIFLASRKPLDRALGSDGVLDLRAIVMGAAQALENQPRTSLGSALSPELPPTFRPRS
jgi:tRNA(Arg) A34 adenosine deaminase TadA